MTTRREIVKAGAGLAAILATGQAPAAIVRSMVAVRGAMFSGGGGGWKNPYVTDGLIAMWDGEWNAGGGVHDQSATVWKDLIGNVDLTLHGGCSWTDKSLTFNGSTGYAYTDVSQVAWANVSTLDCCLHFANQPSQCFVICPSFEEGNLAIMLNGYRLCGYMNPTYRRVPDATVVQDLNHVARTKVSGGSSPWYVDGQSVTCDNGNYWKADGSARTVFGAYHDGQSGFFNGTIRRVCAYSRVLTAAEIAANYAMDAARFNLPTA